MTRVLTESPMQIFFFIKEERDKCERKRKRRRADFSERDHAVRRLGSWCTTAHKCPPVSEPFGKNGYLDFPFFSILLPKLLVVPCKTRSDLKKWNEKEKQLNLEHRKNLEGTSFRQDIHDTCACLSFSISGLHQIDR